MYIYTQAYFLHIQASRSKNVYAASFVSSSDAGEKRLYKCTASRTSGGLHCEQGPLGSLTS